MNILLLWIITTILVLDSLMGSMEHRMAWEKEMEMCMSINILTVLFSGVMSKHCQILLHLSSDLVYKQRTTYWSLGHLEQERTTLVADRMIIRERDIHLVQFSFINWSVEHGPCDKKLIPPQLLQSLVLPLQQLTILGIVSHGLLMEIY